MLDIFHKDGSTIIIFCTGNGKCYQAIKHNTKQEIKDTGFYNYYRRPHYDNLDRQIL